MIAAEFTSVTKHYGMVEALKGLDLTIRPGELTALLGANGAGKTSAVRILLGLARPTSGEIRVFGGDPRDARTRTRIGAVLQSARVPETLRVREHIHLFSSYYPSPMPLDDVIAAAGLQGLERRKFGELSGGQQKRVLFALPTCSSSTSRPSASTSKRAARCGSRSARSSPAAKPCSSRRTTSPRRRPSP